MIAYFTRQFSIFCLLSCVIVLIYCCATSNLFWDKYTDGKVISTEYVSKHDYTTIVYSGIDESGIECKFEKDLQGRPESLRVYKKIINERSFYEVNGTAVGTFAALIIVFIIMLVISWSFFELLDSRDIHNINVVKVYLWKRYKIFIGYPYEDVDEFCDLFIYHNKYGILSYSEIEKLYKKEYGNLE